MKNKKGFSGILIFMVALLLILILGFIGSILVGLFGYAGDNIQPIFAELGVVGDTNLSQVAEYTITPANNFVQAMPWFIGFAYLAMLVFSMIFVIGYESNPHPAFMGAYILFVILLIFGAIILSNMYQDIYSGNDDLALKLKEQTMLSYMILYSPGIIVLIAFITGIYLFSKPQETGGGI